MMRNLAWLCLLAFLLLVGCYWVLHELSPVVGQARRLSTFRGDPDGALAFYRVLQELALAPRRLGRALRLERERGVLFIANPPPDDHQVPDAYSADELGDVDHWVAAGNTVVVLCQERNALTAHLGLRWQPVPPPQTNDLSQHSSGADAPSSGTQSLREPVPAQPTRVAALAKALRFTAEAAPVVDQAEACADFVDSSGRPAVLSCPKGLGRYIVVADTFPMSNRGIGQADNLKFLVGLTYLYRNDGAVFFDEYHHGFRTELGVMAYARQRNLHFMLMQILLLALGGVWLSGRRFGPTVPLVTDPRRDAVEYASALANVYRRSGMLRHVADVLARGFRHEVAGWLHLRSRWSDEQALAMTHRHQPAAREELARILAQLATVARHEPAPQPRELLALSQSLATFEKRFIHGAGSV